MFLCRKTPDKQCHLDCAIMHWTTQLKKLSASPWVTEAGKHKMDYMCQRIDDALGVPDETLRRRGWVEHIRRKRS